ncbi:MAG: spermidine/putrescine transport system ATP-binding protein [Fusobacteriaceae bacterium]|jgi:ABC-type Fe3+/spermidine/putrescine transport system ATPase subunit|nr:spermidine/putrescine transport system ATP-binding protein [Fusobacteriaceae bacterium]
MIELKNITKEYNDFKLKNISFKVEKGEFISLLGKSGSGKSTILNIISGMDNEYRGEIFFKNKNIKNYSLLEKKLAMIFQEDYLFPHLNIEKNIGFGLKMRKGKKEIIKNKVDDLLEKLNIKNYNKKFPHELSGGQKQRVAIARALAIEPEILLMDEPFSALDENLRVEMQNLIKKIHNENRVTTIFVTHDQDEAFKLSDRIILIEDGEILQIDKPLELYKNPKNEKVARFLGMKNIFESKILEKYYYFDKNQKIIVKDKDIFINENGKILGIIEGINYFKNICELIIKFDNEKIYYCDSIENANKYKLGNKIKFDIKIDEVYYI